MKLPISLIAPGRESVMHCHKPPIIERNITRVNITVAVIRSAIQKYDSRGERSIVKLE